MPALPNRTVRLLIVLLATLAALAVLVGSAVLSYRHARADAIARLVERVDVWREAAGNLISQAETKLQVLGQSAHAAASLEMAEELRALVSSGPLYRSAVLVQNGEVICNYSGPLVAPIAAAPEMLQLGAVNRVNLVRLASADSARDQFGINFNTGGNRSFSIVVASPGFAELMRYGDRKADHIVFLTDEEGVILERSVNASQGGATPGGEVREGFWESGGHIGFTRQLDGHPYFVSAMLPQQALMTLWSQHLPLYGALALVLVVCFFTTAWVVSTHTRSLEAELREAARLDQIVAHYQPILHLASGRCAGVEVLMRWQHPERGLVPPMAFIPEAERTGVITQLTERLMVRAMNELETILRERAEFHAAINVPVQTLTNPAFPAHVDRLIGRRFRYAQISFELTESTSLTEKALDQLRAMKDLGIRLAVDDFGTGYSNLRYLSVFPFDFLKIDKAFVDGISHEGGSSGFVDQIVAIGRSCGLQLIAEGIEHGQQAEYLKSLGVEFGQGFLFAAPMPIEELRKWLAEEQA